MLELSAAARHDEDDDSAKFKESKGLLRRAFSSKKRKKRSDRVLLNKPESESESTACICYGGVHIGDLHSEYDSR